MNPSQEQIFQIGEQMYELDERHTVGMAVKDLFAIGCWLHLVGLTQAADKVIATSLQAIDLDKTNPELSRAVRESLHGNQRMFFSAISAHSELNDLLSRQE